MSCINVAPVTFQTEPETQVLRYESVSFITCSCDKSFRLIILTSTRQGHQPYVQLAWKTLFKGNLIAFLSTKLLEVDFFLPIAKHPVVFSIDKFDLRRIFLSIS